MKDNAYLLKHDENSDAIHLPSSTTTGSTWMQGFIESNPGSLSMNRRVIPTSMGRPGRYYDTYQSIHGMDSCSGYDSEVASILSSKNPIYENLPMSAAHHRGHPHIFRVQASDVSVMYKNNKGDNHVMKDNAYLLKHDENSDAIHLPSSTTTGSTWMQGFIESNPGSLSMNRRVIPTSMGRPGRYYDTYQSIHGMDSCSGYDSEVASILSSKNPIYENLPMSAAHHRGHPVSSLAALQHPISMMNHPISSLNHPISSINPPPLSSLQHPISSIQHPISSLHHPISSLHHPISSLHHPISSLHHPISSLQQHPMHPVLPISQPVLHPRQHAATNGVIWQPPSGRVSAEQTVNNNNDSLSSSGVYSEEERKLNLKARGSGARVVILSTTFPCQANALTTEMRMGPGQCSDKNIHSLSLYLPSWGAGEVPPSLVELIPLYQADRNHTGLGNGGNFHLANALTTEMRMGPGQCSDKNIHSLSLYLPSWGAVSGLLGIKLGILKPRFQSDQRCQTR
eukprot:sb/3463949/